MKTSLEKDSTQLEILNRIRKNINDISITTDNINKSVTYYTDTINFKPVNMFSKMSDPYEYEDSEAGIEGTFDVYPNSTYLDECFAVYTNPKVFLVPSSSVASVHINDIAYGNGIYMACGHYTYTVDDSGAAAESGRERTVPRIWTSEDGEEWCMRNDFDLGDKFFDENGEPIVDTKGDFENINEIEHILFHNGYFIMCDGGCIYISDGKKTFTNRAWNYSEIDAYLYDMKICENGNKFIIVGCRIDDGLYHVIYSISLDDIINSLTTGKDLDTDSYRCEIPGNPPSSNFFCLASGKEGYVAVGYESDEPSLSSIYYSKDGYNWLDTDIKKEKMNMNDVIYNNGTYIALGYIHDNHGKGDSSSYIFISYDAEHWTETTVVDLNGEIINTSFNNIIYHGGKYFLFDERTDYTYIYCSDDLQHFYEYKINEPIGVFGVCKNILFANANDNSTIYISKSTPIVTRDITNDEILKTKYPPGSIILSRSPYNTPRDYLGFGLWCMSERCDGVCEYIRIY